MPPLIQKVQGLLQRAGILSSGYAHWLCPAVLDGWWGVPLGDCFPGETRDFMCPKSEQMLLYQPPQSSLGVGGHVFYPF